MASTRVDVQNLVPSIFQLPAIVSGSRSVSRVNMAMFLPVDQSSYTYNANNEIKFIISSNNGILDGTSSYFTFDVLPSIASADLSLLANCSLDEGGVNTFFRRIWIRSISSGSVYQQIERYNQYYALWSNLMMSPDKVDQFGPKYFDSTAPNWRSDYTLDNDVLRFGGDDDGTGAVTGITIAANTQLHVGDRLYAVQADGLQSNWVTVTSIVGAAAITIDPPLANAAAVFFLYKRMKASPRREIFERAAATQTTPCCWMPHIEFLNQTLPLPLFAGGIEVGMELENPTISVVNPNAGDAVTITLQRLRFYGKMLVPHESVLADYIKEFRSRSGIVWHLMGVIVRRIPDTGGLTGEYQIHTGTRSSRFVVTVAVDTAISEGDTDLNRASNSISTWIRSNIIRFQIQVGAKRFPDSEIQYDRWSNEAYQKLLNHVNMIPGHTGVRFDKREWESRNSLLVATGVYRPYTSKKMIHFVDVSRIDGPQGTLSGTDTGLVPLQISLARSHIHTDTNTRLRQNPDEDVVLPSTFTGSCVMWSYIFHDHFVILSQQNMAVLK